MDSIKYSLDTETDEQTKFDMINVCDVNRIN